MASSYNDNKLRGLILGHSFVRRIQRFCYTNRDYKLNLDEQYKSVLFRTVSGGKIKDLCSEISWIKESDIDVVLLLIGSNDLCDNWQKPYGFTTDLLQFIHELECIGIKKIVVTPIWYRDFNKGQNSHHRSTQEYNFMVHETNDRLYNTIQSNPLDSVFYYKAGGIWKNSEDLLIDGVHPNEQGLKKFYTISRGALKLAANNIKYKDKFRLLPKQFLHMRISLSYRRLFSFTIEISFTLCT